MARFYLTQRYQHNLPGYSKKFSASVWIQVWIYICNLFINTLNTGFLIISHCFHALVLFLIRNRASVGKFIWCGGSAFIAIHSKDYSVTAFNVLKLDFVLWCVCVYGMTGWELLSPSYRAHTPLFQNYADKHRPSTRQTSVNHYE